MYLTLDTIASLGYPLLSVYSLIVFVFSRALFSYKCHKRGCSLECMFAHCGGGGGGGGLGGAG